MIRLDLNSPEFQEGLFRLEASELQQVVASLGRLRKLDWPDLYRHTGYRWEAVAHIRTRDGRTVHSIRLSQEVRAIALRDGDYLRVLSLHPDRDSADRRR